MLVPGERDDILERDAAYWLQLIRSYAGTVPVVVVLNKSGGRQRTFDRDTLAADYGPILGWVATDCSEPDDDKGGIAELRRILTTTLDGEHMENVRRKFPRKWSRIKMEVEHMSASFLAYQDFQKLCRKHGELDENEQAVLASDLHDLGVALNYKRDPRLRDTTVLRPDWLANGIYAVLRSNDRDAKCLPPEYDRQLAPDGRVTLESLEQIHLKAACWKMLNAADYPEDKRSFLLRLMDLFHLSYPLDTDDTAQLVPALLSPTPPEGTEEPDSEDVVRLRYELEVVPAPLVPWFIARVFSLIPDRLHWSRGTMLKYDDAIGKVWMTQDERYIFASVDGPFAQRDRLVAIVRGTLYQIFGEYKALDPIEQWQHNGKWVPTETLVEFGALAQSLLPGIWNDQEGITDLGSGEESEE
ncbi:MAG: COR domain-containing protein [Verrucomicrobiales bacterium]